MFRGTFVTIVQAFLLVAALATAGTSAVAEPRNKAARKAPEPEVTLTGPAVLAVVSLRDQRISVYDAAGNAVRARVSSGQTDYETPVGIYSILQKNKDHYSNLYDDAQMPFMQRLTWSGIALHAGALPGYPASHGCVRLPYNYAEKIFGLAKIGTRIIVARENIAPSEISHPLLFKPTASGAQASATPIGYEPDSEAGPAPFMPDLRNWPERQALLEQLRAVASTKAAEADAAAPELDELKKALKEREAARAKTAKALKRAEKAKSKADGWVASVAKRAAAAKTDRARKSAEAEAAKAAAAAEKAALAFNDAKTKDDAAGAELAHATDAFKVSDAVKRKATEAAKEARRKTLPVSVFVSLKTQRVYVRQGHEAVFDSPVSIANADIPIGTHAFTAVDYKGNGDDVRWNVVTILPRQADDFDDDGYSRSRRTTSGADVPPQTDVVAAKAALDRITLPPEVVSKVSQYVWPGSSIIVSDEEMSKETGEATDFVVLISGEPQGGIKKRPRQQPNYYQYDPYYDDYYYYGDRRRRPQRYTPFFSFW
ncbi:MAG TPA: L,D-transpeptidase family protein [Hyphomicrobium zavarzinii]|nr:L,D-transpeptidase family protein [Hyphomicrobium zavarzinii]